MRVRVIVSIPSASNKSIHSLKPVGNKMTLHKAGISNVLRVLRWGHMNRSFMIGMAAAGLFSIAPVTNADTLHHSLAIRSSKVATGYSLAHASALGAIGIKVSSAGASAAMGWELEERLRAQSSARNSSNGNCGTSRGIVYQFRGEDGVDSWSGPLNFPEPEKPHNRINVASPENLVPFGNASIKVEIRPGDPQWSDDNGKGPKRRAEFSWNDWKFPGKKEGWVGAAFYLPEDPMGNNSGTAIFQLHNFPEEGVLWNLFTWDGRLRSSNEPVGNLMDVDLTPYLDKWTRMILNFKPSTEGDGFIRMWLNDKLVINQRGKTKPSGSEGPYFKHGLYFWGYDKFEPGKHAVAYFDNLRIGDETSGYRSVNPACW